MTTPVVRCLKQQLPGAEVHYVTKAAYAPLLEHNPHIDRLFLMKGSLKEMLPELRKQRYDFIIDLHHNLRSLRVKMSLGRPAASFPKLNLKKWLLVNFKWNRLPNLHVVERYFEAAKKPGIRSDGLGPDYFLPPAMAWPEEMKPLQKKPFIVFAIGGKFATKKLPDEKITEICRELSLPVVLIGGPEDAGAGQKIAHGAGPHVLNLCSKLTLHESAFLIRESKLVITHDTGMMHIATAFRKKIISIWGNTVPAFGMYPWYGSKEAGLELEKRFEITGLRCRPCSKLGHQRCPKKHFLCMNAHDEVEIAAAARQMLKLP